MLSQGGQASAATSGHELLLRSNLYETVCLAVRAVRLRGTGVLEQSAHYGKLMLAIGAGS